MELVIQNYQGLHNENIEQTQKRGDMDCPNGYFSCVVHCIARCLTGRTSVYCARNYFMRSHETPASRPGLSG